MSFQGRDRRNSKNFDEFPENFYSHPNSRPASRMRSRIDSNRSNTSQPQGEDFIFFDLLINFKAVGADS